MMKKIRSKKAVAAVIASVCIVALLLAGTFAWYKVDSAKNLFSGLPIENDVLLHDDYGHVQGTVGEINKDIYAENMGEEDVYVRIKLQEFMDLTTHEEPAEINNWTTHIPGATEAFHEYFTWTLGGEKDYLPGIANEVGVDDSALTREPTLPADVITMAEYSALSTAEKADFVGWVYDTDGYAYWSQKLAPGAATGLLLDSVTVSSSLIGKVYIYVINAVLEAVNADDLPMWLDGAPSIVDGTTTQDKATDAANDMLQRIAGLKEDPSEPVIPDWAVDTNGDPLTGTAADIGKIIPAVDDYDWIVLDVDENGNLLIISKDINRKDARFVPYPSDELYVPYSEQTYEFGGLKTAMMNEYDTLVTLQPYAMGANLPVETATNFSGGWNDPAAYTTCTNSKAGACAFPLSVSDVNHLFVGDLAQYKTVIWVKSTTPNDAREWRTRSPGSSWLPKETGVVLANGTVSTAAAVFLHGLRPALWISFNA